MAQMPKRNKSKDNPYTLGYDEENNIYTVEFIDNKKVIHKVEISQKVYQTFDKFELEDISQIHKYRSHIEHSEIYEETLEHRMFEKPITIEQEVEENILIDELKNAINNLSDIQKRRIILYYFEGLTQKEIANIEHTSIRAVQYTLNSAIKKLKEILKKY